MNRVALAIVGGLFALSLWGCAGADVRDAPAVKTTPQFRFDGVNFRFGQLHVPKVAYHTPEELRHLLDARIRLLEEKGLLSNQEVMNKLRITASYQRRFVGDATPFPSDALGYPRYDYKIEVLDGSRTIATIEEHDLTVQGGLVMNAQVIAMALRDKKYEVEFINVFANEIVKRIEELRHH